MAFWNVCDRKFVHVENHKLKEGNSKNDNWVCEEEEMKECSINRCVIPWVEEVKYTQLVHSESASWNSS